jgi:hypothetical protein
VLVITITACLPVLAAISTQNLNIVTATNLANALVGPGVTISNVNFTGAKEAAGTFTGGTGIIGFEQGVILSSGDIEGTIGPNVFDETSLNNGKAGDASLDLLSGLETHDAAILEFDFVPDAATVFLQYVFASDEYNEFVGTEFADVLGFFINGANCARVGSLAVSINSINNLTNFGLYRNNDLDDGGGTILTEMDGLTVVLTCQASVMPNVTNHIKLAIGDAGDSFLDSNVFLRAGSFSTISPSSPSKRRRAQVTSD